jgi:hypothetical protein
MNRNPLMMNSIALSMLFTGIGGNALQVRPARAARKPPKPWLQHGPDASVLRMRAAQAARERRRLRNVREAGAA